VWHCGTAPCGPKAEVRRGRPSSPDEAYLFPHGDQKMTAEECRTNQGILDSIEALGGSYVWDAEVFAVTLMDVAVEDDKAMPLCGLRGIQQVALDASRLSVAALTALAGIQGLQSLVLARRTLTDNQRSELGRFGPEIIEVDR